MSAVHPVFERLFADMASVGLLPKPVIDLKAERVRREREASERRHAERHAEPGDAA